MLPSSIPRFSCNIGVTYKYTVINDSTGPISIGALLDKNLANIIDENDIIIDAISQRTFTEFGTINVCKNGGLPVEKKAYVVASPVGGRRAAEAQDNLNFIAP